MIKRSILFVFIIAVLVYLQTTFLNQLAFNSVKPDIALIAIVYIAVRFGSAQGAIIGFAAGMIEDFISLSPLGFHSFILTIIGYLAGMGTSWISTRARLFQFASLAVATLVKYLLSALLIAIYSISHSMNNLINSVFLIELVYNTLLAPIIFFAGNWLDSRFSRAK